MFTLEELETRHDVKALDYLARDAEIPVLTSLQFQGDLAVIPARAGLDAGDQVPPAGIPVVRGEAGGNTHLLLADGAVMWRPVENRTADLGTVTVAEGATAFLAHPEHGYNAIGAGTYLIRRQREQADEIRLVAD